MRAVNGVIGWTACAAVAFLLAAPAPLAASSSPPQPWQVKVVVTSGDLSQRLARQPGVTFGTSRPPGVPVVAVNDGVRYQRIDGFGAAMTDTSAWLLYDELPPSTRGAVMNDLFGDSGIHLNFLRLPMGASDFTKDERPYSYDDLPPGHTDPRLVHFSIAHDKPYIIPSLLQARAIDPHLEILANPWSPPAWMKTNHALDNRSNQGFLRGSDYGPFARYFVKFLKSYRQVGLPINAITPQNEPTNPTRYPGLQLDSSGEIRFITKYLHPALRRAGLHPAIYGSDYGWSAMSTAYAQAVATGRDSHLLTGIAWHCYFGGPGSMSRIHALVPRLQQILDECSPGITPFAISELAIASIRNWAGVVALWNLALDPRGGPVQPPNNGCPSCTGVVTVNQQTHSVKFNTAYFQLGQVSSFVERGAVRIKSRHFVTYDYTGRGSKVVSAGLDDVALLNPDGSRVLIAYNNSTKPTRFAVKWHGRYFTYTLQPEETATFVWNQPA